MPERLNRLKEIVNELEAELATVDTMNPEAQKALEGTLDELHAALGNEDQAALEDESIAERLRGAEAEFQLSHPTVSGIVLRVINALGQLGI